jgi:hypothetical protein
MLWQWSTTAANNANAATNIDWQYGMPPSDVSPSARQMMADIATWFQTPEWLNYGNTPTYVNATQFTVPGNLTAIFTVGRRVRTFNTGGTFYGTITASAYTSLTTVTVSLDSGSIDSGLSEVDVHIVNPALHNPFSLNQLILNEPGNGTSTLTVNAPNDSNGANIRMVGNGSTTPNKSLIVHNGLFAIVNSAYTANCLVVDDSGNGTFSGNMTANSDERLKRAWEDVQPLFLELLAAVECGTFERISTGERNAGVTAQSLQKALPEAVMEGPDGYLSVAYGQAALVAVVKLTREVLRLRELLEPVK